MLSAFKKYCKGVVTVWTGVVRCHPKPKYVWFTVSTVLSLKTCGI